MKFTQDSLVLIDPIRNHKKFYNLEYDAFDKSAIVVTRRWGRIGTAGQEKSETFDNSAEARTVYYGLLSAKIQKGYRYAAN